MKEKELDALVAGIVARLKSRRLQLGMSVNKLSELAGMSHVGILQIESGNRSPQLRTALKLANALGLELGEVIRIVRSSCS